MTYLGIFICSIVLILTGSFLKSAFTEQNIQKELKKIRDLQKKLKTSKQIQKAKLKIEKFANFIIIFGLILLPFIAIVFGIRLIIS